MTTTTKITVENVKGELENPGYGQFFPVAVSIDGKEYGVDAYPANRELTDWVDGNGLLRHALATPAEVWAAVDAYIALPEVGM